MRKNIVKKHSTKAERRFYELLKKHRIPFLHRVQIRGREIDFIIGKYAIEIDGHLQKIEKNDVLMDAGYIPVHIDNKELRNGLGLEKVEELVKKLK